MAPSRFGTLRAPRALVLTLVLLGAAGMGGCGSTLGLPCEAADQCGAGLSCVLEPPGGMCSRGCTEAGSTRECPDGTLCTPFGHAQLLCSTGCDTDAQCRVNYACVEVGGPTSRRACRPELILP